MEDIIQQSCFIDVVLIRRRRHLQDAIARALSQQGNIDSTIPLKYITLLYCDDRNKEETCVRYAFANDQIKEISSAGGQQALQALNELSDIYFYFGPPTGGSLASAKNIKIEGGLCAPISHFIRNPNSLGVLYLSNWKDSFQTYFGQSTWVQDILAKEENTIFKDSRDLFIVAIPNMIILIHSIQPLKPQDITAIVRDASESCRKLFYDNALVSALKHLHKIRLPQGKLEGKEFVYPVEYPEKYPEFIDYFKSKLQDKTLGKMQAIERALTQNQRWWWESHNVFEHLVGHGFEHSKNVANLFGAFYRHCDLMHSKPDLFVPLWGAAWLHDGACTRRVCEELEMPDLTFMQHRKLHGKLLMNLIYKKLQDNDRDFFLTKLGLNINEDFDRQLIQAIAVIAGYHQKSAKIQDSCGWNGFPPQDPYSQPIPEKMPLLGGEVPIQLSAAILCILDACEISALRGEYENKRGAAERDAQKLKQKLILELSNRRYTEQQQLLEFIHQGYLEVKKKILSHEFQEADNLYKIINQQIGELASTDFKDENLTDLIWQYKLLQEAEFHYQKHSVFRFVTFDEDGWAVFAPCLHMPFDLINYYFEKSNITSVKADVESEIKRVKDILDSYSVTIRGARLFDAVKDKFSDFYSVIRP
jgi:hypothetical protein